MTVTTNTIKKKKIAIVIIILMIICGLLIGILLKQSELPTYLKEIVSHEQEEVEPKIVKKINKNNAIAVYYPVILLEDKDKAIIVNDLIESRAKDLLNEINEKNIEIDKEAGQLVKVDYEYSFYSDTILSIHYWIIEKINDVENRTDFSYMIDISTASIIDTRAIYDDYVITRLTDELRYQAKSSDTTNDYSFSREFLEKTKSNRELFTNFVIEGNVIRYFINDLFEQPFVFEFNLNEIANHISIDLGVVQDIEDPFMYIPRRFVDPNRPMIALTFDDGPHKEFTPLVLEVLRDYNSAATFFVLGNRINSKTADVILETIHSGSELGSHSWSHPNLTRLRKELDFQLNETVRKIYEEVSAWCYQPRLYRPPYGLINRRVSENSLYPFIMWSVDPRDWETRDAQATIDAVMSDVKDGSIIIMHDIHEPSKDAAIQVIPMLIDAGYQLVTVSEMMQAKGIEMQNGDIYYNAYSE